MHHKRGRDTLPTAFDRDALIVGAFEQLIKPATLNFCAGTTNTVAPLFRDDLPVSVRDVQRRPRRSCEVSSRWSSPTNANGR